ncbi:1-aminocyclopropane-1-carboxylate deaminase, partial [Halomonas sp. ND22Bw]|uniref:aminotransferase class I/II-fold pyridoxal phosphate-dependent enzyme n=1 Tax=Halomonas sp. ND22Bw TaxID=2054178 RepID=UPI000D2B1E86
GAALRDLHAREALAGILVMSPANPSGTVIEPERLADLCATARGLGVRFFSDEIYHGLSYGLPTETALRYDDYAIVINSF